ncbi:GNAT family N-acetyltransferase [Longimycelium tulufanense]|uniref:GNAT family N-acetyltransferase n=1 Tax=Longimycelium tulufanense TaxID=907463 RepID=UPI00166F50A7|nr:GNAT family N-acetyltransferase [Longimycelium tulufanense]
MELRIVPFDHPDAVALSAAVQQEYVQRYGDEDVTPIEPDEFTPPRGLFLVGYLDDGPVACGGWRARDNEEEHLRVGDAELKRMYVVPEARGNGLARALLAELERTAALAGRRRVVLETGTKQPEAIALYLSCGYIEAPQFGVYRGHPCSRCFSKLLPAATPDARAQV